MASGIVLPKPTILVRMVCTHNQTMEILTNRYTEPELEEILDQCSDDPAEPIKFWGCDESGKPARVSILHPQEVISYILLDWESVKSMLRQAQIAAGGRAR